MDKTRENKRKIYIDLIKIIACFFVIADHTNYFFGAGRDFSGNVGKLDELLVFIYATVFHSAVTLFVMSSGALLLGKGEESYKRCFMRVLKCIAVIIIFTLPYYIRGESLEKISLLSYFKALLMGNYVMSFWYLYMYLALLIMLPMIRKWISTFQVSDYIYFFIFSILCSFDFITGLNEYYQFPLFVTYVGIFVMGYFLDNFEIKEILFIKLNNKVLFFITSIIFALVILGVSLYSLAEMRMDNTVSNRFYCWDNIFYIYMSFYIFYWGRKALERYQLKSNLQKWIIYIGGGTYGIYLIHQFIISINIFKNVINYFLTNSNFPKIMNWIILDVVIFVICEIISQILKKLPLFRKLL